MRFNSIYPLVWHKVGDWLSITADDNGFAIYFQLVQEAGEVSFRFVNIHGFHVENIVPLIRRGNEMILITTPLHRGIGPNYGCDNR